MSLLCHLLGESRDIFYCSWGVLKPRGISLLKLPLVARECVVIHRSQLTQLPRYNNSMKLTDKSYAHIQYHTHQSRGSTCWRWRAVRVQSLFVQNSGRTSSWCRPWRGDVVHFQCLIVRLSLDRVKCNMTAGAYWISLSTPGLERKKWLKMNLNMRKVTKSNPSLARTSNLQPLIYLGML